MVKDVHVYFRHFSSHLLYKDRVCCLQLDMSVNITRELETTRWLKLQWIYTVLKRCTVIQLKYRVMYMYRRLGRTCTLQQIRRHINDSSCSSSTSPKFKLQLCRCYNWSLLETLTVHGWTSRCLPVRFVFCFILYNRFILELYTRISIWFKF